MHKGSWGHEGSRCHHSGSKGKGWGWQRKWPDGLYSLCTPWHVSDVVLPSTSFHPTSFVDLVRSASFLCALMPSDPDHVPRECHLYPSLLALYKFICLSWPIQHTVVPCVPVCTARGRNNAQQPESDPVSQFPSPVSPSTHTLSHPVALHAPQRQPEGTKGLVLGI